MTVSHDEMIAAVRRAIPRRRDEQELLDAAVAQLERHERAMAVVEAARYSRAYPARLRDAIAAFDAAGEAPDG